jgi:multiple sugar transport system permease protein
MSTPVTAVARTEPARPPSGGYRSAGPVRPMSLARWRGPGTLRPPARSAAARAVGREAVAGYVFLSPWLLGLMLITAVPMLFSLYLSFTNYDVLSSWSDIEWVGLDNYRRAFSSDPTYWHAVTATTVYVGVSVPLKLGVALGLALLLNRSHFGVGPLRALFYLPALLGGSVALALVWFAMFGDDGALNGLLGIIGIDGRAWVRDPDWALTTLIVLAVWQFGAPMVIFLAGLRQIPVEYYESAAMDGAGPWTTLRSVTLPALSPVIFFNLVLEMINGFQGFTAAFVISNGQGGPVDSTMLYSLYLYIKGFTEFEMGYASALAWIFLVAVGLLTVFLFATSRYWVRYRDEE